MKVLWISSHGGNYKDNQVKGTGGWVGALQTYLTEYQSDFELGICFAHNTDSTPLKDKNVTYFPVLYKTGTTIISKLKYRFFGNENKFQRGLIEDIVKVIKYFNPDIIHIWGIENNYAAVIPYIKDIPFVVHIQGLTAACSYTYCPPMFSLKDIFKTNSLTAFIKYGGERARYRSFLERAERELLVSKYVRNWLGRTDWDKEMSKILSTNSTYYHCDEMMRSSFNISKKWQYHYDHKTIHIQSNISEDWYKGMDLVLKTAKILKNKGINIEWKIFGWERKSIILKSIAKKLNIIPEDVNVYCCGRVAADKIKDELLYCDVYVHPSYIENSSNAIAEAQLLGVPVIAQYVGGNPTMLKNKSGCLVQPNEPYIMASTIIDIVQKANSDFYSKNSLLVSAKRQNKDNVVRDLLSAYKAIINNSDISK